MTSVLLAPVGAYPHEPGEDTARRPAGEWTPEVARVLRVALAQLNTVVGDVEGNLALVRDAVRRGAEAGAALTLVPELALTGYPPEDLLLRRAFADASRAALEEVAREVREGAALVGFADAGDDLHNAAAVLADGRVQAVYHKRFLPNYGVFDEARYFAAGTAPLVVEVLGARVGVCVCEDIWYPTPVAGDLARARLDLIACISSSPYHLGKAGARERMLQTRAADCAAALAFCNQVGGQDELVFDGRSAVIDATGEVVARSPAFRADLLVCDLDPGQGARRRLREPLARLLPPAETAPVPVEARPPRAAPAPARRIEPPPAPEAELWGALVTGLRDYVDKNGFPGVVIGLSGGIDSALTAAVAVDALGPDRVMGVTMPSVFSAAISAEDASALARALGIRFAEIPIAPVVDAFEAGLAPVFAGRGRDVTEENLQARVRGTLLMAVSNKLGLMVLATGNKSEMSVGYSTIYGDMVGGFAPLRDVAKTWVQRLARWRNREAGRELIPGRTITRPPSAELRPDQADTDSLPPYDLLDRIIEGYVEDDLTPREMAALGLPQEVCERVVRMVDRAEYKRRQGPPGIKTTPRAFGRDRRMPITNRHDPAR
jgi:NAD+ synthase (glutamine-hydrolysing)